MNITYHAMVDLETLSTVANAGVISIGAVVFGSNGIILDKFYRQISIASNDTLGREKSESTLVWWSQQTDEAKSAVFNNQETATHIVEALEDFSEFLYKYPEVRVWGCGASFDNSILANCYQSVGKEQPWQFWNDRCYRTIKSIYADVPVSRVGVYHNAVDDAETQAVHLINISKKYGFELK